jgi:hypothetical protein
MEIIKKEEEGEGKKWSAASQATITTPSITFLVRSPNDLISCQSFYGLSFMALFCTHHVHIHVVRTFILSRIIYLFEYID